MTHGGHNSSSQPEQLKIVVTGLGESARQQAKDAAHEQYNDYLHEKTGVRGFARRIWGNMSGEARKHRMELQARKDIEASGNVFHHERISDEEWADLKRDTILRFTGEYDDFIETEAGERRIEVAGDDTESATEIRGVITDLIRQYADGTLDDASFEEEKNRALAELARQGTTKEHLGEGAVFADNLHEIARAVSQRIQFEQGAVSVDEILAESQLFLGEARIGARSEANLHMVERLAKKLDKWGVNEATAVTAATAVYAIGRWSTRTVTGAALRFGAVGVGAGLWAGIRARGQAKQERRLLSRERAMGLERDAHDGDSRREKIEGSIHEMRAASDIIGDLGVLFDEDGNLDITSADEISHAAALLADVKARQRLSGQKKADLISFESIADSAQQRLEMMRLTAQLNVQLRDKFDALPDAEKQLLVASGEFTDFQQSMIDAAVGTLTEQMTDRDVVARKLYRKEFAKGFVKGTLLGAGIGLVAQEAVAAAVDGQHGLVDSMLGRDEAAGHSTLLDAAFNGNKEWSGGGDPATQYEVFENSRSGAATTMTLPEGFSAEQTADGLTVTGPDGTAVENLHFGPKGRLSADSLEQLKGMGLSMVGNEPHATMVNHETTADVMMNAREFVAHNREDTVSVTRTLWYDNDTSSVYDQNELGLQWGGHNGTDGHGNVVFNVAGMQPGGSFHGAESANPDALAGKGDLMLLVSASKGTQTTPFEIMIRPDGQAVIPADSPAADLFEIHDGQVTFHGAYVEAVERVGNGDPLEVRPLATYVGEDNVGQISETVTHTTAVPNFEYEFAAVPISTERLVDVPPVIPIVSRRTIKPRRAPRETPYAYLNGYERPFSSEEQRQLRAAMSPRLRVDGDAELDPTEELSWYRDEFARRDPERLAELEQHIGRSEVLRDLPSGFDTIVTIPVAAPNENKNIYNTLSLYAQQDETAVASTLVVLNLNWLDTALDDPEKRANIEETRREIERARRDFPGLKIEVFEHQYNQEEVTRTGGVIGYVARDLVDAALLIAQQKKADGTIPADGDVLIQRHDVDMEGMSRSHLSRMQQAFRRDKSIDIFKGLTRFGVRAQRRYPGFGIVTDLSNMLSVWAVRSGHVHTGGANFAVRASTLAAVGGLGDVSGYSGAGSDDLAVGRRISFARSDVTPEYRGGSDPAQAGYSATAVPSTSGYSASLKPSRKIISYVNGANIDTNVDRLLPFYLTGDWYQEAWGGDKKAFGSGAGGYADRRSHATIMQDRPRDRLGFKGISYKWIETNLSAELSSVDEAMRERALAVLFKDQPGAYTLKHLSDGRVELKFTSRGRRYLRRRAGRQGQRYAARKMDGLYGNGLANKQPALVSRAEADD